MLGCLTTPQILNFTHYNSVILARILESNIFVLFNLSLKRLIEQWHIFQHNYLKLCLRIFPLADKYNYDKNIQ